MASRDDQRGDATRQDQQAALNEVRPRSAAALLREVVQTLRAEWRAVILAILGALCGLLAAELFDASDDAKTVGAMLGAAAGASLKAIADRFGWRDRTLTAGAVLLGLLGMPRGRSALLHHAGTAMSATASAPSGAALVLSNTIIAGCGAVVTLGLASGVGIIDGDSSHPLAGRWQTTSFASTANPDVSGAGFLAETWRIHERCRERGCAHELSAVTAAGVPVPQQVVPVVDARSDGTYVSVRVRRVLTCTGESGRPIRPEQPGDDPTLPRATVYDRFIMTPRQFKGDTAVRMDILRRSTRRSHDEPVASTWCGRPSELAWRATATRID